jgi:hypothetical protein
MSLFSSDLPEAPEVFFVHPANARYLRGTSTDIRSRQGLDLIGHGLALALLLIVGVIFAVTGLTYWRHQLTVPPSSEQISTLGATACLALIPLIFAGVGIPAYQKRLRESRERRLTIKEKGQIVVGEVISVESLSLHALLTPQRTRGTVMRYRFHAPGQGEAIHETTLPQFPLFHKPNPGISIALVYVDETLYEVL